jgi:hypothetical protein
MANMDNLSNGIYNVNTVWKVIHIFGKYG